MPLESTYCNLYTSRDLFVLALTLPVTRLPIRCTQRCVRCSRRSRPRSRGWSRTSVSPPTAPRSSTAHCCCRRSPSPFCSLPCCRWSNARARAPTPRSRNCARPSTDSSRSDRRLSGSRHRKNAHHGLFVCISAWVDNFVHTCGSMRRRSVTVRVRCAFSCFSERFHLT